MSGIETENLKSQKIIYFWYFDQFDLGLKFRLIQMPNLKFKYFMDSNNNLVHDLCVVVGLHLFSERLRNSFPAGDEYQGN